MWNCWECKKKPNKNDKQYFYHEYGGNVFICVGNKELHIKNTIVVENSEILVITNCFYD